MSAATSSKMALFGFHTAMPAFWQRYGVFRLLACCMILGRKRLRLPSHDRGGFPSVLVEPGEAGARNARKRGLAAVICATLSAARFRSGVLPAAGLFDVLEHVNDAPDFLRELHLCLVPGGRLYATAPSYSWLWSDDDVAADHFHRYTQAQFRRELKSTGFQPIYSSYFFSLLPLPL